MKSIFFLFFFMFVTLKSASQTITGFFPQAVNKEISLLLYNGLTTLEPIKTKTDNSGNFKLNFTKKNIGTALLQINNASSVIILLNQENFEMEWENLQDYNTLNFLINKFYS